MCIADAVLATRELAKEGHFNEIADMSFLFRLAGLAASGSASYAGV